MDKMEKRLPLAAGLAQGMTAAPGGYALKAIGFRSVDEAVTSDFRNIVYGGRDEKLKREQAAIDAFIEDSSSENLSRLKELRITSQRMRDERFKKKLDNLERLKEGLKREAGV